MGTPRLLVVDDDPGVVDFLVEALQTAGHVATGETSPRRALERVKAESFDLLIADIEMPELRGLDLLDAVCREKPGQLVLLMTAFGSIDTAVQAMRAGACEFVTKPFPIEVLLHAISRSLRDREMRREIVRLRARLSPVGPQQLVASSPAMRKIVELARRAAESTVSVLLTGESGSGKGAVARFIHDTSPRRSGPYVHLNCAALPEQLVEGELFGVRRGAFTGADADRPGLFVEASGGSLFLDEIGEMPQESQAKLLQVLETRRVRPLGGGREQTLDVRVIAATNSALEEGLRNRTFRPDLYYRLNVIRLDLPPLRERREDVLELAERFLTLACGSQARDLIGFSAEARRWLLTQQWPGNVRELANAIERAVALAEHDSILLQDLEPAPAAAGSPADEILAAAEGLARPLAEVEREYIRRVLDSCDGNKAMAARMLGIDRRTLYRKV